MYLRKFAPRHPLLQSLVESYLILEMEEGRENRILPNSSIVFYFRYRGRIESVDPNGTKQLPASGITGLFNTSRLISYSPKTSNLLVTFRETGAAAFFRESLHEFFAKTVSLRDVFSESKIERIEEELSESSNDEERIQKIECFLLREWKKSEEDALVQDAIRKIRKSSGEQKIKYLVAGLPVSVDVFEKRFRRVVGTSPKRYSSIVRMRHLIDTYSPSMNFTDLAYSSGYFDQAHFTKEFKAFTGLKPKEFFKNSKEW
ncbi:helix-turn-helix domain-containing protein [Leptospira yasudae]|uniref:helix-turn-helix domain-containing protein n=1 Tax=Leptospira yasudae TaxID=2202201 RepID=UPI001083649E|nr:helix-turn-helix domain-containing protein [Leptospira yasudae]TGK24305.1 helix-turn-helix domain-containing protein [Leptospira yasudae]TGM05907.1 helix-turn-helix domain-containing protein [Leptospira yasudae]